MQKIKHFGKKKVHFPIPYLFNVQKEAWENFWDEKLKTIFREVSPIRDYSGKQWEIYFLDYKLEKPKYKNGKEAKENNDTYEAPLKIEVELRNLKTKKSKKQEIFLCDFPLMTEKKTFIINGVERVAISQLIRSPGAFFTAQNIKGEKCFGAKIVPSRGTWLEFQTEPSGFIGVKIDRRRKVPATTLLKAIGLPDMTYPGWDKATNEDVLSLFKDVDKGEVKFIEKTLEKDTSKNRETALVEIYRRMRPGDIVTPETARELVENTFFNFGRYDISEVGRWKMWQRLPELKEKLPKGKENQKIGVDDRLLYPEDIVAVLREVIRMNNDNRTHEDEIDHLGNRRVRPFTELLEGSLRLGLARMERNIKDRISTSETAGLNPAKLINSRPFATAVQRFFSSSQISQFMDCNNPLSESEHKRRLTSTGPGGLKRERAGLEARDVQASHYGRICPIQTPEGPNVGLVSHFSLYSRMNHYGFLETPYFKVEKTKVTSEIVYLNAHEEEKYIIAHGGVELTDSKKIISDKVEGRLKGKPGIFNKEDIQLIDVSAEQLISVAASMIPFLQNDDANRALMGSNMQRQAVPLLNPQAPLVSTGTEERVAADSGYVIINEKEGEVVEVDGRHIVVKSGKEKKEYFLETFSETNQYTCFHQRPVVKKGEKVKKGHFLTDGGAVENGRVALGQNVLVAFMPWRGKNFEDAVILSERLVKDDVYTSLHIENFACDVRETKLGPEITTADIPNVSEVKLKDLDEDGIIRVGAEIGPNDILVGKISPKGKSELTTEERLLKAIFGEKAKDVKDTSLTVEHGKKGRVIGVKVFTREEGHKLDPGVIKRVEVKVAQMRKIKAGDKLAGRHGNKGVISQILPREEMPFLEDGTPVDIVLNPLSVVSRMNLGQILETHLGLAAKKNNYIAVTPSFSGASVQDIEEELEKSGLPRDGKMTVYDGQTGKPFKRKVTVGYIYMLKLEHMVEDKLHMRSIGPYSLITQQPLGGKAQFGGQRFGEMEVWALEGYGAAYTLQEMLTIKSDDVPGRAAAYEAILKGEPIQTPGLPASFELLVAEIKAMGISITEVKKKK
jgi:DNA-directed RNA polymerase subunit beta